MPRAPGRSAVLRWILPLLVAAGSATATATSAQDATPVARAAVSDVPVAGVRRVALPPQQFTGYAINRVFYDLLGGTGSDADDRALRARIEELSATLATGPFNEPLVEQAVAAIRAVSGLRDVGYTLYASEQPGAVVLVISATLHAAGAAAPRGYLVDGAPGQLPVLYESADALLRVQLNVWGGLYTDHNPWFGSPETYTGRSPVALDPPGAGTTTWAESMVEYGLAGASRVGSSDAYAFGEATAMSSGATGQDLFRSDTRTRTLWEKAYAGVLWAQAEDQRSARLSAGRQNWQLNNGFLFSRFAAGANAGPNPALYLNPRTTYQMAVLADFKAGPFELGYFDLDPAELEDFDSDTRFQGLRTGWTQTRGWDLGAAAYRVPESRTLLRAADGSTTPRDGQRTYNLRAGHRALGGGFSVLSEYAYQDNPDADVSARAFYAQLAYTATDWPWKPNLNYRYASFSGDDPATATFEAFDAPLSSGLDEWVQGVNFKKVAPNTNLNSHRLRLNLAPNDRLNYTLDYYFLEADEPLVGGERSYGREFDLVVRWSLSRQWYFLGVTGVAWPGAVVEAQTGGSARPWSTVQASLFWNF